MPEGATASGEGVFVPAGDLPPRFEETPGEATPGWRRTLELNARLRAQANERRN